MNSVDEILASIRDTISGANHALDNGEDAAWLIQTAFVRMRILLEAAELHEALKAFSQMEESASKEWDAVETDEYGEPGLKWAGRLYQYIWALASTLGQPKVTTVTKDLIQILRATQYSITDKRCFRNPPSNEAEVHARIEAVLRCVFPDLLHKPAVSKQIKNFQPDTGLPSIHTLIEYKFILEHGEEKRIADELLADSRGYVSISGEWKNFVFVIYETKRIKSENQWKQLLNDSGITNTEVIVLSGEEPQQAAERQV